MCCAELDVYSVHSLTQSILLPLIRWNRHLSISASLLVRLHDSFRLLQYRLSSSMDSQLGLRVRHRCHHHSHSSEVENRPRVRATRSCSRRRSASAQCSFSHASAAGTVDGRPLFWLETAAALLAAWPSSV